MSSQLLLATKTDVDVKNNNVKLTAPVGSLEHYSPFVLSNDHINT